MRDAHTMPLVGERTAHGFRSWRESPETAWTRQFLELGRTATSVAALVFDCDQPDAARDAILGNKVAVPNWKVVNPNSGHLHVAYALEKPIHRYPGARPGPLKFTAEVAEYYQQALQADPGYAGVLTRNPAPQDRDYGDVTEWGVERPYRLEELAQVIPFKWQRPKLANTGVGRNCDLHQAGMKWAGNRANEEIAVLPALIALNQTFTVPLPMAEVTATARSIERYRARWAARGWHTPAWMTLQKERGRAGGLKSGQSKRERGVHGPKRKSAAEASNEVTRPWEAEGISRRTWYRRARLALIANTDSTPGSSVGDQTDQKKSMKAEVKNVFGKISAKIPTERTHPWP